MMVTLDVNGVAVNGKHKVLLCASFFYFRIPREKWEERADAIVAAGYNTVDIYFPWNYHETAPGTYRFDGDADADAFLALCAKKGLMIIARPGPYICSEWDGGALPAWIAAKGNVRSADPQFLAATKTWYDRILPVIKKYEYDGQGGVILVQLDNELDFFDCPDPEKYIGALRDMAKESGICVPLFACAGQLNALRAGGLTKGVYPTYNFYPDSLNAGYDGVLRYYADTLGEMGYPLLISETNRDAFLLRREYAAGAKLLGAYNQVGGSNFGFTPSVNNWGAPLAFLSTQYDFESLITTLGEYSADIDRQRIFSSFLLLMGERGAAALPYRGSVDVRAEFTAAEQSNALELPGGGVIVCLSSFGGEGKATVTACGHTVTAHMRENESIFLPFGVPFGAVTVECANCEPIGFDGHTLTFHTDFAPYARINGKEFTADGETDGVAVRFISDEKAAVFGRENAMRAPKSHVTYAADIVRPAEASLPFAYAADGVEPLDAVGVYRGYAEYTATAPVGKKLFLEYASDIVTAYIDGKYFDTRVVGGTCVEYPATETGNVRFTVEKWGNSNFDDSRCPSMRLVCRKGAHGLYAVEREEVLRQMRFTVGDAYGESATERDRDPQTMLCNNAWNTTRMPAVCNYSFETARTGDKLYLCSGSDSELCVFVDGKRAGTVDYTYFDLTPFAPKGKRITVTAQYRKRHWAEEVGDLRLLQLKCVPAQTSVAQEKDFAALQAPVGNTVALPFALEKGKSYRTAFALRESADVYVDLCLRDCKATAMANGRVAARIMGEWSGAPTMVGGDSKARFYLPAEWTKQDRRITLFIECVGENPAVEKIEITQKN